MYQAYLGLTADFGLPVASGEARGDTRKEKDPGPSPQRVCNLMGKARSLSNKYSSYFNSSK